jgi:hypothetical protein
MTQHEHLGHGPRNLTSSVTTPHVTNGSGIDAGNNN